MRLRKSVRAPDRFEDEAVSFTLPKKKQITTPAFPLKMRNQWVLFDKNAPAAAFPSLPLSDASISSSTRGERLGPIPHNLHLDKVVDLHSDIIEIDSLSQPIQTEKMNHVPFTATVNGQKKILNPDVDAASPEENSQIAWSSLELPVQYRIWTSLRRDYSQEDVAIFLRLSPKELREIRIAVEKRCQCPIDSSEILERLDTLNDHDGSLLDQFTPYLLIAQSYELVFPEEVERGVEFLSQLDLDQCRLGAWTPDPAGSGFLKAMPSDLGRGFNPELDTHNDSGYSSPDDDNRMAQAHSLGQQSKESDSIAVPQATVSAQPPIPEDIVVRARVQRYASIAEYNEELQATAAKHRDQREKSSLQSQALPRNRQPQVIRTSTVQNTSPLTARHKVAPPPVRRPVIIKNGIDPMSLPSPDVTASTPLGAPSPVRSNPVISVIESIEPPDTNQETDSSPPDQISSGNRSSGSMSLRGRDRLRDTRALAALKQNLSYWDNVTNEISDLGSDDDIADLPLVIQLKVVSMKINNKSALASIFEGDREIRAKYVSVGSTSSNTQPSATDVIDDQASKDVSTPFPAIPAVRDEPILFASYFTCGAFPEDESKRLLAVPIEERTTVEMWLIYGINTWNAESPWNTGRAVPKHGRPADGALLNRDQAGSLLARTLVDEWNLAQTHGLGEQIVEATDIGIVMVSFHQRMLEAQSERDELNQFEEGLEDYGATDRSKIKLDAHRLYMGEVQNLLRRVHGRLDQIYADQFHQLGRHMPVLRHRTPSIIRTSVAELVENQPSIQTDDTRTPSLPTTPHQSSHKATGSGFAMRLIETPSTQGRTPPTPPEDDLGIFDSDGMGVPIVDQVGESKKDNELLASPTRAYGMRDLVHTGDSGPLAGYQQKLNHPANAAGDTDVLMADLFSGAGDTPTTGSPLVINDSGAMNSLRHKSQSTPNGKDEKQSPRQPSWSPISDNDDDDAFHSAIGTPSTPATQVPTFAMSQVMQSPGNLSSLLFEVVSRTGTPASTAGEADTSGFRREQTPSARVSNAKSMPRHTEDGVLPSIETDEPKLLEDQSDSTRLGPRLKLTLRMPSTMASTSLDDAPPRTTSSRKQAKGIVKPIANKDPTLVSEATTRVTRSMSTTPGLAQNGMTTQLSSTTAKVNGTSATESNTKTKGSKKAIRSKIVTPVNPQIEAVKGEAYEMNPTIGRGTQAKPRSTGKAGSRSAVTELAKTAPQLTDKAAPKSTGTAKNKTTPNAITLKATTTPKKSARSRGPGKKTLEAEAEQLAMDVKMTG
jgi:hypothetical protein